MFAHHIWATRRLIDHLGAVASERLQESVPGTYGSILATLGHLLAADDRYLLRLYDAHLPAAGPDQVRSLGELRDELDDHERRWGRALAELERGELHAQIRGRADYPDLEDATGMLLLQAIHHGNDHRTQVCTTLGALGEDVPDLDGWMYWVDGRT